MFAILKIIKALLFPPAAIAIGIAAAFFLLVRKRVRWGRRLLLVTLIVYYAFTTGLTAFFLTRGLEMMTASLPATVQGDEEAIVVLAGGADQAGGYRPFDELGGTSWRRLWRGLAVYQAQNRRMPLLYAGGSGDPFIAQSHEAVLAKQYAVAMGMPEEQFLLEDRSRDTYESAWEIRRLLDERFPGVDVHRVVLVTSARHMPRAYWTMRKAGIAVVVAPADFGTGTFRWDIFTFIPSANFLFSAMASINEWAGIGIYWLLGRL